MIQFCKQIKNYDNLSLMSKNSYRTIQTIGKGSFGVVDLVEQQENGNKYVIKRLNISHQNNQCVAKEVKIMKKLKHQYIIKYDSSFVDENNTVCIVMEYAEKGDLEQYLNKRRQAGQPLSEVQVLQWFIQLCLGLKYIHDHKILHRDIKCENIFIDSRNELKIGDFGISRLMHETFDMAKTKIGTPYVMAPEIWENKKYNQKSDLWSLGCVLYKMMTLNNAFEASNPGSYIMKITTGKYNPIIGNYSSQLKNLVSQMLCQQPQNRPSVHSILERSFLKDCLQKVLCSSLAKFELNLKPLSLDQQRNSSNNRLCSQRRSFSSLSNSSMLTPKNSNAFDHTKMVQMKQIYPILVQQSKQMKEKLSCIEEQKQKLAEDLTELIQDMKSNEDIKQIKLKISQLQYKLSSYFYP